MRITTALTLVLFFNPWLLSGEEKQLKPEEPHTIFQSSGNEDFSVEPSSTPSQAVPKEEGQKSHQEVLQANLENVEELLPLPSSTTAKPLEIDGLKEVNAGTSNGDTSSFSSSLVFTGVVATTATVLAFTTDNQNEGSIFTEIPVIKIESNFNAHISPQVVPVFSLVISTNICGTFSSEFLTGSVSESLPVADFYSSIPCDLVDGEHELLIQVETGNNLIPGGVVTVTILPHGSITEAQVLVFTIPNDSRGGYEEEPDDSYPSFVTLDMPPSG